MTDEKNLSDDDLTCPTALKILVVDSDPTCLAILEQMLRSYSYQVTTTTQSVDALVRLRERKDEFDLVMIDIHMPEMDGFQLLKQTKSELDIPVIMFSSDENKDAIRKGFEQGACDFLIKPFTANQLKNIWKHVARKKMDTRPDYQRSTTEDISELKSPSDEFSWKSSKRKKEEEEEEEEEETGSSYITTLKRPRIVWTKELHKKFVEAVNDLGVDRAVPKKILELMNDPGLTRENVASHLQKYRMYLKKLSTKSKQQSKPIAPITIPSQSDFGAIPNFDGLDVQRLSISNQLPLPSLSTQATLRNSINTPHYMPRKHPYLNKPGQPFENMGMQVGEGAVGYMNLSSLDAGRISNLNTIYGRQTSPVMRQMGPKVYSGGVACNGLVLHPCNGNEFSVNQYAQFPEHGFRFVPTPGMFHHMGSSSPTYCQEVPQILNPEGTHQYVNAIQGNCGIPLTVLLQHDIGSSESNGPNVNESLATQLNEDEHENRYGNVHYNTTLLTDINSERSLIDLEDQYTVIGSLAKQSGAEKNFKFEEHLAEQF